MKKRPFQHSAFSLICFMLSACQGAGQADLPSKPQQALSSLCPTEFIILGAGQDAGAPQIGYTDDPAWTDPALRLSATSAALVHHKSGDRYLFEATPDISKQLQLLNTLSPSVNGSIGLSGIFLTHAHIGHYTGLMYLGREAASTNNLPVYLMPRFKTFIETNGPWAQLVTLGNIKPLPLKDRQTRSLGQGISVMPYRVPHRDEYSETVGYIIKTAGKSVLFLPDIDDWDEWERAYDTRIEDLITQTDYAFIDATFFSDNELGRDMSEIPHPRVEVSMDRFDHLPPNVKSRVHFIHYNHSNKIRYEDSDQTRSVIERGYNIARAGNRFCLTETR